MQKKNLVIAALFCTGQLFAQKPNWQNLDFKTDTVFGISTEKAYKELLVKKKHETVVVGVIDSGVDTAHEDLKAVIWVNPKEIPGNGIDDDHDGYVDDLRGWDFIGGPKGDINQENLELTRMIRDGKATPAMQEEYNKEVEKNTNIVRNIEGFTRLLNQMTANMKKDTPTLADFQNYQPKSEVEKRIQEILIKALEENPDFNDFKQHEIEDSRKHFQDALDYELNLSFNPRPSIVGDDSTNPRQSNYGNSDVYGPSALHGTHVSGIIAAVRNNGIGIDGIANDARILIVRVVPDGDERDKDVANAIRFAADHGARVINMSFGKGYSPDKKLVDEAVKYAVSKDVLLIHAAGNDAKDLDKSDNFPNRIYADSSGQASSWIEVGASGFTNDSTLVASFSNYGKKNVDVFAPGVRIRSTIPDNKYTEEDGTSMACPVVVGLATLIREYYPKLSALEVKDIILKSVEKPQTLVTVSDNGQTKQVPFSEVCVSGGIVNAYNALLLAESYKHHKK